ncbi:MAG: C40 family peptidase [Acidiferrobacterales bacterium]
MIIRQALILLSLFALLLTGCSSKPAKPVHSYSIYGERAAAYAQKFIGTRYKYGGDRPGRGFDCSGLVQYSYKLAGLTVPRNTKYQFRNSRRVSRNHLRRGDLLFFNQEGKRNSHVGIYIGKDRFVHAPSSGKNVKIATLKNRYWQKSLSSTRRFEAF